MKILKTTSIIIVSLIVLQWLTYLWIGLPTLKNRLLTGTFSNPVKEHQDSLFVRDYFLSDCYTGDDNVYLTNNLSDKTNLLKDKFMTNHIYFDKSQNFMDTTFYKYNVAYFTYASRSDMFEAKQYESIIIDKKTELHKDVLYQWLLFGWLTIDESNYSEKLNG